MKKTEIRKRILKQRLDSSKRTLSIKSKKICQKLGKISEFKKAKAILFYIPVKNEVDILPLLKKSLKTKTVLVPKIKNEKIQTHQISSIKDLETGPFKIPQPNNKCPVVSPSTIDLVLVPGIAFDKAGNRIGFGFGYYDRLLKKLKCKKIGLAYDFQIVENVPRARLDQKVDLVICNQPT